MSERPRLLAILIALGFGCGDDGSGAGTGAGEEGSADSTAAVTSGTDAGGPSATPGDGTSTGDDVATTTNASSDSGDTGAPATECLTVPDGWSGPVRLQEGEGELPCDGAFPNLRQIASHTLDGPPADCTCSCADAEGMACGSTRMHFHSAPPSIGCPPPGSPGGSLGSGACHIASGSHRAGEMFAVYVQEGFQPPGSCAPSLTESFAPPTWETTATLCSPAPLDECPGAGQIQVPIPTEGELCIVQPGQADCADAGPFTAPGPVLFDSFEDTRSCGPCSCGLPQGSCDLGNLVLYSSEGSCQPEQSVVEMVFANTACFQLQDDVNYMGAFFTLPAVPPACEPSPPDPLGDVQPRDPLTVCCMP